MKLLSKDQIYEADKRTAQSQNISSTDLMERAGMQIFNWLHIRMQGAQVPIHIFCGIGNNGGDGLVLARHLFSHGYNVNTYVVNYSKTRSKDFLVNYDRYKEATQDWPEMLEKNSDFPEMHRDDIIIDAVFGIGLNRPPSDWVVKLFDHFRRTQAYTVAVDIPSGLYTDRVPEKENAVVSAHHTLSFQTPKLVFFLPDTAKYTIQWEILDIGLDPEYLYSVQTQADLIGKNEVVQLYRPRDRFAHKGHFGHVLTVGGSYGKIGAVTLASRGALSAGAGLVTVFVPNCGYVPLQSGFPEAMVITDKSATYISDITFNIEPTVVAVGMGMGTSDETILAFEAFLKQNKTPLVVDADALNILSKKKKLLKLLPENSILTPHASELERLIGKWQDDFDKLKKAQEFSKKYSIVLVLKGANTITVYGDKLYVNSTGNPSMATAGSGDVLTGVIAAMVAQGYDPLTASIFGVYLHGRSGDIMIQNTGHESLIATYLIEGLGSAYLDLFAKPEEEPQQEDTSTSSATNNEEEGDD